MKGLLKYLSPFAPDLSGAVSVLFELNGLLVILDAGGCAGNACGFDEPRWFRKKSAVFSAGLRDMDAILGRDDKLMEKIKDALSAVDADFIGLIGTPVPSVIGTDFLALKRMAEKKFGLPVVTVESNGMETYEKGQEKALLSLLSLREEAEKHPDSPAGAFFEKTQERPFETGVFGATPLDLPSLDSAELLSRSLTRQGYGRCAVFGFGAGMGELKAASRAARNVVVSPSGAAAAKKMEERFGIPYSFVFPCDVALPDTGKTLIVHQQIFADALRKRMRLCGNRERIDVASFFRMATPLMEEGDVRIKEEEELPALIERNGYDTILGDPLFRRVLKGQKGRYGFLPHYAVSGALFACDQEEQYFGKLRESLKK